VNTLYKGHDALSDIITDGTGVNESFVNHDKIRNHINTQNVSHVEGCDRILGRPLQKKAIRLCAYQYTYLIKNLLYEEATEDSIMNSLEKKTYGIF